MHYIASECELEQALTWVLNVFPNMKKLKVWKFFQIEVPRSEVFVDQPDTSVSSTPSAGRREFLIDGLLANLGVGISTLFFTSIYRSPCARLH